MQRDTDDKYIKKSLLKLLCTAFESRDTADTLENIRKIIFDINGKQISVLTWL